MVGMKAGIVMALACLPAVGAGQETGAPSGPLADTVRVAVLGDWPPHYVTGADGRATGFAVEMMQAVAARAGLVPRFVVVRDFVEAGEALASGAVDVIPDYGVAEERMGSVAFTRPFGAFRVSAFVRRSDAHLGASGDLAGRTVGVVAANAGEWLLTEHFPDARRVTFPDVHEALFELLAVGVDGVVYPEEVFLALARSVGVEERLRVLEPPLAEVPRAMAVRPEESALLARLDRGVEEVVRSADYQRIYSRWFGQAGPGFWTVGRVAWGAGGLLLLALLAMAFWRYRSIAGLARELARGLEERDRAQEALQEAHRLLARTLACLDCAVFVIGPETRKIIACNAAAETLFGRPQESLVGLDTRAIHVDELAHREFAERSEPVLAEGRTFETDFHMRRADGTVFPTRNVVSLLDPERGIEGGVVSIVHDVTRQVEAQAESEELGRRLRQSQRLEAVGRLAGGIAHDFNNLLTVIRSQTDLILLDLVRPSPLEEELKVVQSAADRAAEVTSHLLAFSRDQVLRPRTVDLGATVGDIAVLLRRIIGEDVQMDLEFGAGLPPAHLDPGQLEQVVMNLGVNARDAMPEGGRLRLRTYQRTLTGTEPTNGDGPTPGRFVVLEVSDTGMGMDADTRRQIFEPFFTTKPRGTGTGLGLAMVYGFVHQSGGHIEVESEPGRGTTFVLYFPASGGEVEFAGKDDAAPDDAAVVTGRILLVEDDASVRRVTQRVLEHAGFQVDAVEDAESALDALESGHPADLLLTDLGLPGLGGRTLLERAQELRPGLAVIAMSGYAVGSPGRLEDMPADLAFLQKPFTGDDLVALVRAGLGRR